MLYAENHLLNRNSSTTVHARISLVCNVSLNLYLHDSPQECRGMQILGRPTWCKVIPAVSSMKKSLQSSCKDQKTQTLKWVRFSKRLTEIIMMMMMMVMMMMMMVNFKKKISNVQFFKHPHHGLKHNHFPYHLPWTKSGKARLEPLQVLVQLSMHGGGIQISRCLKAAVELFGHYGLLWKILPSKLDDSV